MKCEIIQDLLPLYHDNVCSAESRAAVEEHLPGCGECRRVLADMDAPLPEAERQTENDAAVMEKIAQEWRRLWRRALLRGAAIVLALFLGGFAFWYSVTQITIPMDSGDYDTFHACVLESGEVAVEVWLNKACRNGMYYETDKSGDDHLCILRPLLRLNIFLDPIEWMFPEDLMLVRWKFDPRNYSSAEPEKVYFGVGEDSVLLWSRKDGYAVPAATEEEETFWNDWSPGHVY